MKFIPLHTRNTAIIYKNALCSSASIIVLVFVVLSVMVPVLLVSLLSPYSGIAESRILYEQPQLQFEFQNIFVAETKGENEADCERFHTKSGLVACSSFSQFNTRLQPYSGSCESTNFWAEDLDYDNHIDRVHFQQQLDAAAIQGSIHSFDLVLFFQAKLKHKCALSPPAVLIHHVALPASSLLRSGTIHLKAELQLKQYIEFTCPFPGRNAKTHFHDVSVSENVSFLSDHDSADMQQFQLESLLQQLKLNPAYFQLDVRETYLRRGEISDGLSVQLDLNVLQVPARYNLSIWERLGQFWLYFASFFGISFYLMNMVKDFLFGRHIIRSWEIIPWKKLY